MAVLRVVKQSDILGLVKTLPPLPTAIAQLAALGKHPDVDSVVAIVRHDPALAAAVLRRANAAAAAPSYGVTNVHRATVQVGTRAAIQAAMSAAFAGVLPPRLPGYGITREAFAEHCITVGELTTHVIRIAQVDLAGDPFIAGLLHDSGKLVLCRLVAAKAGPIETSLSHGVSWHDAEHEHLGANHAELGGLLAEAWKLPALIVSAARFHHHPQGAPSAIERSLAAAVHVANAIAHDAQPDPAALTLLTLSEAQVADLAA